MRRRIAQCLTMAFLVSLGAAQRPNIRGSAKSTKTEAEIETSMRRALVPPAPANVHPYQVGTASWYGRDFDGKPTASGETYNMFELTAAHPTLPLGALIYVGSLGETCTFYNVVMQLYTAEGPKMVRDLIASGKLVFLDLKYHDIPNAVAAAVRGAVQLGVSMLTVHASGGTKMLKAAVEASGVGTSKVSTKLVAITVLTSMDEQQLHETGVRGELLDQVVKLGSIALDAGCAGVVSSAREVKALRARLGTGFLAVRPGVRPAGAAHGAQAPV